MQDGNGYSIVSLSNDNIFSSSLNKSNLTDSLVRETLGFENIQNNKKFLNFNRFDNVYNNDELSSLIRYIFIVRPDLNLLSDYNTLGGINTFNDNQKAISNDPIFKYMMNENPMIIRSLTSNLTANHHFIPFLVGRYDSFQIQDYNLRIYDNSQLFTGYKQQYPGNAIDSQTGISFDISFREDKNLNITKFFYTWCYYIDGVLRGKFDPARDYIVKKIADYMTSMYYIVCGPDGKTILYFMKNTGFFPTNTPFSNWSYNKGNVDKTISINFSGFQTESLNPVILKEFNYNAGFSDLEGNPGIKKGDLKFLQNNTISTYNDFSMSAELLSGAPYIYYDKSSHKYFIEFFKREI